MFPVLSIFKRSANSTEAKNSTNYSACSTKKQKFIGSPLFNVLLMVVLMLGVSAFFRVLEWRSNERANADSN